MLRAPANIFQYPVRLHARSLVSFYTLLSFRLPLHIVNRSMGLREAIMLVVLLRSSVSDHDILTKRGTRMPVAGTANRLSSCTRRIIAFTRGDGTSKRTGW